MMLSKVLAWSSARLNKQFYGSSESTAHYFPTHLLSNCFFLSACPLLSAYFLAVSCYKRMCLTTSTYDIEQLFPSNNDPLSLQLFSCLLTVSWRKYVDAVYSTCLSSVHPSDVGGGVACPTSIHKVVVRTENWYHNAKVFYAFYIGVQWNLTVLDTFGPKAHRLIKAFILFTWD